jgi:hypothetical protein
MDNEQQPTPEITSPPPATIDQLLNAAYKLNDWLNFYWNFYVVFVGVVFGWIFSAKSPWQFTQQFVVATFFIGFAAVSIGALARTYCALNRTSTSLREKWGHDPFKDALLSKLSQRLWRVGIVIHLIADATVIYCIWTFKPAVTGP